MFFVFSTFLIYIYFRILTVKIDAGEDPTATLGSREESEEDNVTEMLEDLFAGVILATDPLDPNRQIHLAFRLLPSKKVCAWRH